MPTAARDAAYMLSDMWCVRSNQRLSSRRSTAYADLFDAKKTIAGRLDSLNPEGLTHMIDEQYARVVRVWRTQVEGITDSTQRDALHISDDLETLIEALQPVRKALRPFATTKRVLGDTSKLGPRPFPLGYKALQEFAGLMREARPIALRLC